MTPPVRLSGIGVACSRGEGEKGSEEFTRRLSEALSAVSRERPPVRLFHSIEEVAFLAAHEALAPSGIRMPLGRDDIGIALGIEEGIDGIKARYYRGLLADGPLGASPIAFPFTAPNTIAARISILLDLRGESFTVCGGCLSGAQAIGLALESLRGGRSAGVLAGGATSVQQEFLDALRHAGRPNDGQPECGACVLLLEPQASSDEGIGVGLMLGYGEGFGTNDGRDAVQACLEDAELFPEQIMSVRVSSVNDLRSLVEATHEAGVRAPILRSPSYQFYSASFPMAVAEAVGQPGNGPRGPVLVVGRDCLVGAAAVIVGEGRA